MAAVLQVDAHDVFFCYARGKEVVGEQLEKRIRLSATTYASDYLYQTIALAVN